jgi:protein O-mannosyl-transferase
MIMPVRVRHTIPPLVIIAVLSVAYANSFQGVFVFDDFSNIANNRFLANPDFSLESLKNAATRDGSSHRWLPNLSFAINYALHGRDVAGYHTVNLLIHIATALSLYFLFLATLRASALTTRFSRDREIAFLAALLWAVHPVQTNGVTYIVQRMTSMCALFYISSLLLYVYARRARAGSLLPSFLLYGSSLLLGGMALLSKENAASLPLMIVAYEFTFLRRDSARNLKKIITWAAIALLALTAIGMGYLGQDLFSAIARGYETRDFTMTERLLTQPVVFFLYLGLLALPSPARLNLNHDVAVSQGLFSPPYTFFAIIGLAAVALSIPFLYRRTRLLSFGLFWFLATLVIESSVVPLEMAYEHRLYLPSTMLFLGLTALGCRVVRSPATLRAFRILLALLIGVSVVWTWQRNQVWSSRTVLWQDVVTKSPALARGYINLGAALMEVNLVEAEKNLRQAVFLDPDHSYGLTMLGLLYVKQNRLNDAITVLHRALASKKEQRTAMVCDYLGIVYRKTGNYSAAIRYGQMALQADPGYLSALINLGVVHEKMGEHDKADSLFQEARARGADGIDLYNNWGITAHSMGQVDRAIDLFRQALRRSPGHIEAHYNLGIALGSKGMVEEAQAEMKKAMLLRMQLQGEGRSGKN